MNSYIVSKETFYKLVGENAKYVSVHLGKELWENEPSSLEYHMYFALENKVPFAYNSIDNILFIPTSYIDSEEVIKTSVLSFENWKITFLDDTMPYIKNEYKRSTWLGYSSKEYYPTGRYEVKDVKFGWTEEVAIWYDSEEWNQECYICYPGKSSLPLRSGKMKKRDEMYKIIFKENGRDYCKTNIRG